MQPSKQDQLLTKLSLVNRFIRDINSKLWMVDKDKINKENKVKYLNLLKSREEILKQLKPKKIKFDGFQKHEELIPINMEYMDRIKRIEEITIPGKLCDGPTGPIQIGTAKGTEYKEYRWQWQIDNAKYPVIVYWPNRTYYMGNEMWEPYAYDCLFDAGMYCTGLCCMDVGPMIAKAMVFKYEIPPFPYDIELLYDYYTDILLPNGIYIDGNGRFSIETMHKCIASASDFPNNVTDYEWSQYGGINLIESQNYANNCGHFSRSIFIQSNTTVTLFVGLSIALYMFDDGFIHTKIDPNCTDYGRFTVHNGYSVLNNTLNKGIKYWAIPR